MNRINSKRKRKKFSGHFLSTYNDFDWIAVAIRCPQLYRPSAFDEMAFVPEAKQYWNGYKGYLGFHRDAKRFVRENCQHCKRAMEECLGVVVYLGGDLKDSGI